MEQHKNETKNKRSFEIRHPDPVTGEVDQELEEILPHPGLNTTALDTPYRDINS